jgi:hypothetical protein
MSFSVLALHRNAAQGTKNKSLIALLGSQASLVTEVRDLMRDLKVTV